MQLPNYFRLAMMVIVFALPTLTNAQNISSEEKTAAIQTIARHIAANYLYAEKGGQIASHIQMANHRGDFRKAANWKEFDEMVTASMRKFSDDEHLYVKHDPDLVSKLKNESADTNRMYIGPEDGAVEMF